MEFICWIKEKHYAFSSRNFLHHWFLPLNSVTGTVIKIWLAKRNAFRFFFFFLDYDEARAMKKKSILTNDSSQKLFFFAKHFLSLKFINKMAINSKQNYRTNIVEKKIIYHMKRVIYQSTWKAFSTFGTSYKN